MNGIKYVLINLLFLLILFIVLPAPVIGHVLEENGTIGGVFHIDPDDDPYIGENSTIFVELKDTHGEVTPENCECAFLVKQGDQVLSSQPLFQNPSSTALAIAISYTFPKKGMYTLVVSGKPIEEDSFEPFAITHDIRVERERKTPAKEEQKSSWVSTHTIHILGIVGIILFIVAYTLKKRLQKP